jgi:hypothetical protein
VKSGMPVRQGQICRTVRSTPASSSGEHLPGWPTNTFQLIRSNEDALGEYGTRAERATACSLTSSPEVFGVKGATSVEWKGASGLPERTFYRVRAALLDSGHVSDSEQGISKEVGR